MEEVIAQPPADLRQGLHTLLFVNGSGKRAVTAWATATLSQLPAARGKIRW